LSRTFVKDADEVEELVDRPIAGHHNDVSKQGLQLIEAALKAAQEAHAVTHVNGDRDGLASAGRDLRY
jgi:hypothetical protein